MLSWSQSDRWLSPLGHGSRTGRKVALPRRKCKVSHIFWSGLIVLRRGLLCRGVLEGRIIRSKTPFVAWVCQRNPGTDEPMRCVGRSYRLSRRRPYLHSSSPRIPHRATQSQAWSWKWHLPLSGTQSYTCVILFLVDVYLYSNPGVLQWHDIGCFALL